MSCLIYHNEDGLFIVLPTGETKKVLLNSCVQTVFKNEELLISFLLNYDYETNSMCKMTYNLKELKMSFPLFGKNICYRLADAQIKNDIL